MTVMDPRPWSPTGPHIGPDDDDLAMLVPTGDPEADLGSTVLAVHRVGAAACEAVARAPLPDEFRLVDALAAARAALAAPAVEAVSKCVTSDNPRGYADLLLTDLFDAGETGSLAVYRACVSKGVAPPLAVQRAGLVYGVPHGELGRYLAVAAEPKSHPVAIADAADRAVAAWASGVVRDEVGTVVSKADHQDVLEYNATPFGQEHPKGQEGRFVATMERPTQTATRVGGQVAGQAPGLLARLRRDTGAGGQAAPEVADAPVEVVAPPETAPRPVRRVRRVREVRRTRREDQTAQAPKAKIKASLRSTVSAKLAPKVKARLDAQRTKPSGEARLSDLNLDSEADISAQFTGRLDRPLAWSMSVQQANEIFRDAPGAGTYDRPKHVQMGQLQTLLAEPIEWGDQHNHQMQTIAEDASGEEFPRFIRIDYDELEGAGVSTWGDPETAAKAISEYAHMAGYYDQLAHEPSGSYNPLLKGAMSVAPSADPATGDWFLVVNPESVVYGKPDDAPLAASAEFVVSDPAGNVARVNVEGSPARPSYELDPTQHWVIKEPTTLWKQTGFESGHWVDRYTVEPLDDWHDGKALATKERWRTEPRNAQGEWSSGGGLLARVRPEPVVVSPVVTQIAPRAHRKTRSTRKTRAVEPKLEAKTSAQMAAQVEIAPLPARLETMLRAVIEQKEAEAPPRSEGFPIALDDRPIHRVLSSRQWAQFLQRYTPRSYADDVRGIELPGAARMAFAEGQGALKPRTGDEVNAKMRSNVARMVDEDPENRLVEVPSFRRTVAPSNPEGMADLYDEIVGYMDAHPDVAHMQIGRDSDGGPFDLKVYRNLKPVKDQVIIYAEDDIDWDRPVSLMWVGKARRADLNRGREYHYDPSNVVDAPASVYRAEQRTWRAHQDER